MEYRHHRIVQDVAFSLSTVRSSRQLTAAVRNSVECVVSAVQAGWMHCDISEGNIMLDDEGEGVLNDWDHATKADSEVSSQHAARIGTWQFMSIGVSNKPNKPHDILDDLESHFWVLMYKALYLFDSNATASHLKVFEDCDLALDDGQTTGGSRKALFLTTTRGLMFQSKPLQDLTETLRRHFLLSDAARNHPAIRDHLPKDPGAYVLKMFDDSLARSDWPVDERIKVPTSSTEGVELNKDSCFRDASLVPAPKISIFSALPSISGSSRVDFIPKFTANSRKRRVDDEANVVGRKIRRKNNEPKGARSRATPQPLSPSPHDDAASSRKTRSRRPPDANVERRVTRSQTDSNKSRVTRSRSGKLKGTRTGAVM
ncbi:hypothetical protein EIP91_009727 [Steccherinum ochraceum]|uniref:Fungal-type protein kinase domain-containing protein n=1 Tax=Steccherinum ochraceum TaxID=92696 RepID=A0A4V2MV12_9APHY|nr:hypothetical protein EIP91_009727 [Steccherinum ochraceum]